MNSSICFVSPYSYPVLAKTHHQSVGGAEVQQVMISRELAKRGFDVSFVVGDYNQQPLELVDGIHWRKNHWKRGYLISKYLWGNLEVSSPYTP